MITETIEHVFAIFCVSDDLGSMKTFFKGYPPPPSPTPLLIPRVMATFTNESRLIVVNRVVGLESNSLLVVI